MQGILGISREADRQAMERDAMNMRGGVLRQDPGLMQRIGGAVADYAVPDRYLPSSVMEPRLDMSKLESLRGTPVDMADAPNPVPMLMDTMPMAGITAFHGSPHKFSKFDMSKIGTGEGAQAYGHGLYFAENPNVAKNYVPRDWDFEESLMGHYKQAERNQDYLSMEVYENAMMHETPSELRARYVAPDYSPEDIAHMNKAIDRVQDTAYDAGNLYKVDIPDDQIAKMLDWDKPLSEQQQVLQDMARKSDLTGMKEGNRTRRMIEKWRDGTEQADYPATGHTFYNSLSEYGQESVPELSQKLYEAGIPGIKYLDGGSRTGGQGTSNFVLFDDQIPQILEINDKPVRGVLSGQ